MIIVAQDTASSSLLHSLTVTALQYNLGHVLSRNPTSTVHAVGLASVTLSDKLNFRVLKFDSISDVAGIPAKLLYL